MTRAGPVPEMRVIHKPTLTDRDWPDQDRQLGFELAPASGPGG